MDTCTPSDGSIDSIVNALSAKIARASSIADMFSIFSIDIILNNKLASNRDKFLEVARKLIKKADSEYILQSLLSETDSLGRTLLHYAVIHLRVDLVRLLLSIYPAQVDMRDNEHKTPENYVKADGVLERMMLTILSAWSREQHARLFRQLATGRTLYLSTQSNNFQANKKPQSKY